jgi:KDO2-lipid IV(A) lauroyltransferase
MQVAIARLPFSLIRLAGSLLGMLWYTGNSEHRRTVKRNIAFAFPDWPPVRVNQTAKKAFRHFGITVLETIQLSVRSPRELRKYFRIEGMKSVQAELAKNKGLLMISAHVGNWEVGVQMMACFSGRPVAAVAKKLKNRRLDDWINAVRTRLGANIIYKKGAMPSMVEVLRRNGIVGIHIDMSRQMDGIDIEFFSRKATATPAAALIALRHKCPVMPVTCLRDRGGEVVVRVGQPLELVRTKNLREDLQTNTQIMTDLVEQTIRSNPVQWWWLQKRWKDYYPGLYPEHFRRQADRLRRRLDRKKKWIMRNSPHAP